MPSCPLPLVPHMTNLLLGLQPEGGRIRLCLDRFLQFPEALAQIIDIQQQQREDWWHLAKFQVSIRQRPLRHKKSPSKTEGLCNPTWLD